MNPEPRQNCEGSVDDERRLSDDQHDMRRLSDDQHDMRRLSEDHHDTGQASRLVHSDNDSGCALEEYSWVPPGLKPEHVRKNLKLY